MKPQFELTCLRKVLIFVVLVIVSVEAKVFAQNGRISSPLTNNLPKCRGEYVNSPDLLVSPLSKMNTVVLQLQVPDDFDSKDFLNFDVVKQPVKAPIFAVNSSRFLYVASDNVHDDVDLSKDYNIPLPLEVRVQSDRYSCVMPFKVKFFDQYLAVEPEWDANPVLASEYRFDVDCFADKNSFIGKVGAEKERNEIFNVTYAIEAGAQAHADGSDMATALFKIDPQTGDLRTNMQLAEHSSEKDQKLYHFRVSASAPEQSKRFAKVFIRVGTCDGSQVATTTTSSSVENTDASERHENVTFIIPCRASQGEFIGQLPQTFKGSAIKSYSETENQPEFKNAFSVTNDGRIRILNANLSTPKLFTNFQIFGVPADKSFVVVYHVDIQVDVLCVTSSDDSVATTKTVAPAVLKKLFDVDVSCPLQIDQQIVDLNAVDEFRKQIRLYKLASRPFSVTTSRPDLIRVLANNTLVWIANARLPTDESLQIVVNANTVEGNQFYKLGYLQLTASGNKQLAGRCAPELAADVTFNNNGKDVGRFTNAASVNNNNNALIFLFVPSLWQPVRVYFDTFWCYWSQFC